MREFFKLDAIFLLPVTLRLHADESFLSKVNEETARVKTARQQSYWSVEDSAREKRWMLKDGKGWKRKETGVKKTSKREKENNVSGG